MKLYERVLTEDVKDVEDGDLIYEQTLFTLFLQSFFVREDGEPI